MNGLPSLHRITIWIENKEEFANSWQILLNEHVDYIYPHMETDLGAAIYTGSNLKLVRFRYIL